jgi:hypothetical protein
MLLAPLAAKKWQNDAKNRLNDVLAANYFKQSFELLPMFRWPPSAWTCDGASTEEMATTQPQRPEDAEREQNFLCRFQHLRKRQAEAVCTG